MAEFICKFDEYGPGMGFPKMSDYFEDKPYYGIEKIINYLNKGKRTVSSLAVDSDFYTGEALPFTKYGMTDGKYSWTSSLAYYVEKYNLRLPKEFEEMVLAQ